MHDSWIVQFKSHILSNCFLFLERPRSHITTVCCYIEDARWYNTQVIMKRIMLTVMTSTEIWLLIRCNQSATFGQIISVFVVLLVLIHRGKRGWRNILGVVEECWGDAIIILINRCPSALLPLLSISWTEQDTIWLLSNDVLHKKQTILVCVCACVLSCAQADVGWSGGLRVCLVSVRFGEKLCILVLIYMEMCVYAHISSNMERLINREEYLKLELKGHLCWESSSCVCLLLDPKIKWILRLWN